MKKIVFVTLIMFILQSAFGQVNTDSSDVSRNTSTSSGIEVVKQNSESKANLESKIDFISNFLSASSFLVGVISVLFTIFFFVAINIANSKYKELKNNYDTLKKSFKKDYDDFILEINLKQTEAIEKIEADLNSIRNIQENLTEIRDIITGNQNYIYQGLEQYYDILFKLANNQKDTNLLSELSRKQGIINTYSLERDICFAGVTTLMHSGNPSDIKFLEKVRDNKSWDDELRYIAHDAIKELKNRKRKKKPSR